MIQSLSVKEEVISPEVKRIAPNGNRARSLSFKNSYKLYTLFNQRGYLLQS